MLFTLPSPQHTLFLLRLLCLAVLVIAPGVVHAASRGAEPSAVTIVNNALAPSSELSLRKGESVTFTGTDVPLTVRIKNAQGGAGVPASSAAVKNKDRDLILSLGAGKKITVLFTKTGEYRFSIEGLNPGLQALKCGVDVLPHSVEGVIRVRE